MPTLADLVTDHPGAAPVLERFHLDYCCGGQRPLEEACAEVGVDPAEVLAALDAAGPSAPPPWAGLEPGALADHLEATHHRYLDEELPRLSALVAKVVGVHGDRHPELHQVRDAYEELRADLEPHLRKEERVLFPLIRNGVRGDALRGPIGVMDAEHDRAGDLLALLAALTNDYTPPPDGCASYVALYEGLARLEADTHLHVHKENNVLFPAVLT